ncbi:DUF992 domain-containing protein [Xanthobacter sp. AM11]|uniref:DUF992 domain-containing protein n=1 Tax=Xanthobacter sp. AM11 TaxID=3380643 RepID=UPI0039BF5CD0
MKTLLKAGLAAVALLAAGSLPASAQSRVQVGTLVCNLAPNISFVIGSVREMSCAFRPSARGVKGGSYQGTVTRVGLDIGFSGAGELVWAVFAPSASVAKGALRGTYVGASSNASIGVGLGANVLVGGSQNTFALQPLSVQGQTGLNLALGVSGLTLR